MVCADRRSRTGGPPDAFRIISDISQMFLTTFAFPTGYPSPRVEEWLKGKRIAFSPEHESRRILRRSGRLILTP